MWMLTLTMETGVHVLDLGLSASDCTTLLVELVSAYGWDFGVFACEIDAAAWP